MDAFMEEFQHLKIQLEEIQSATDNFSKNNVIGCGGFGNVYKGVIPSKQQNVVAIKRLNPIYGQGNAEFWREIMMLSRYTHENLISLVGFCDERGEKILVYEYAYHGSLDCHLSSPSLTWTQRIKICVEAAQGLSYLHDDKGTQQRVLHRDIKSSNILLDENWKAKVSDMGLSKIGPSNQLHTAIITDVVGTLGYLDPLYIETGVLSKESDVYSFGVVLFEVLCGKLCYEQCNGQYKIFVRSWKESYKQNHLADIIFQNLAQQINPDALGTFSEIAFQCLQKSSDKRPTMLAVVEKLESALESQDSSRGKEWLYYEEIARTAVPPLKYRSKWELMRLLSNGVFLNGGETRFWLDNNGNHCEMISIEEERLNRPTFAYEEVLQMYDEEKSRYVEYSYVEEVVNIRTRVHGRAQFLSPLFTYTTNLVFKASNLSKDLIDISSYLRYVLVEETEYSSIPHHASKREDGSMMVELFQFTSDGRTGDLEIEFELCFPSSWEVVLKGIEFRPLEKVEHKVLEHEKVDAPYPSDSDPYWEQILPNDYQEILEESKFPIRWTTKKELYVELCKGFLMNNGHEWFFLNKNGKKCHMLSAKPCIVVEKMVRNATPILNGESRFGEHTSVHWRSFQIVSEIRSQVLSPETTYATYLVYQLPTNLSDFKFFEDPVSVIDMHSPAVYLNVNRWYIYLRTPQVPVIRRKVDENTHNPPNSPKVVKCFPQQRSDGWMEVQVWEFQTSTTTKSIPISLELGDSFFLEFFVLGIEFRPI